MYDLSLRNLIPKETQEEKGGHNVLSAQGA